MAGFSAVLAGYGERSAFGTIRVLGQCGIIIGCGNNIVRVVCKDYIYVSAAVFGNFNSAVFIQTPFDIYPRKSNVCGNAALNVNVVAARLRRVNIFYGNALVR